MRLDLVSEKNTAVPALRELAEAAGKLDTLLDSLGEANVENTLDRMEAGEDPDGSPWEISARVKAFGGQTMIDKGHLHADIHHQLLEGSVFVGTSYGWVIVHQEGWTISAKNKPYMSFGVGDGFAKVKSVTMPKREIFGVSEKDEEDFKRLTDKHFEGTVK